MGVLEGPGLGVMERGGADAEWEYQREPRKRVRCRRVRSAVALERGVAGKSTGRKVILNAESGRVAIIVVEVEGQALKVEVGSLFSGEDERETRQRRTR